MWLKSALHASSHPCMCTCVLRLGCFLFISPVFYFVPPFSFQPFLMFTSEFNERSRSNPLCDFRLGTVATSDHETPLTVWAHAQGVMAERAPRSRALVTPLILSACTCVPHRPDFDVCLFTLDLLRVSLYPSQWLDSVDNLSGVHLWFRAVRRNTQSISLHLQLHLRLIADYLSRPPLPFWVKCFRL